MVKAASIHNMITHKKNEEEKMKKSLLWIVVLTFCAGSVFPQQTNFFDGALPSEMSIWTWGFVDDNAVGTPVPNLGYSPGTSAVKWETYNDMGWQGIFFYFTSYEGVDLAEVWDTDSVYFKMRAPNGLGDTDEPINVTIYDPTNTDVWDYAEWYELVEYYDMDGDDSWQQYAVALADFELWYEPIDQSNIIAVSFEYYNTGVATQLLIDEVWIGRPEVSQHMTFFNGNEVVPNLSTPAYRWGFQDDSFVLAEGEGATPGTNAMLWENNVDTYGGLGFEFPLHDMTYTWTADTIKLKVNAPAGINDLMLVFWDNNWATAQFVIDASVVTWDGTWKSLEIPIADFTVNDGFDKTIVYALCIQPAADPVPERILFDDFWIGCPSIDIIAPPAPAGLIADVSTPYLNLISWDNIAEENGETYDVFASMAPITDLNAAGVFAVAVDVPEDNVAVHNIDYPVTDGEVTYYYAVTCTDAAGNQSEGFGTSADAYTNTGKAQAIISLDPPDNFSADGDLDEWLHIMPFTMTPEENLFTGEISDFTDYSASCYVAMDAQNLYVAFDVFDDVFSWTPDNTVSWWEDENIEFYFGLYELGVPHATFQDGDEPDYRLVFLPDGILLGGDPLDLDSENYYFEPLGNADYVIEARIPFSQIQAEGDAPFVPADGMTIPFEIFAADADVTDGMNESRLQLGDNPALNPWGAGPDVWTSAWVGMPNWATSVEENDSGRITDYALHANYPNPFNPKTTIRYAIPKRGDVSLNIYDSLGRRVKSLQYHDQPVGQYKFNFDGSGLTSGVYFYTIQTGEFTQTRKMILLK